MQEQVEDGAIITPDQSDGKSQETAKQLREIRESGGGALAEVYESMGDSERERFEQDLAAAGIADGLGYFVGNIQDGDWSKMADIVRKWRTIREPEKQRRFMIGSLSRIDSN